MLGYIVHDVIGFVLCYYIFFVMFWCYILYVCSFLMIEREGVNPNGGEDVVREGKEIVIKIYCTRK